MGRTERSRARGLLGIAVCLVVMSSTSTPFASASPTPPRVALSGRSSPAEPMSLGGGYQPIPATRIADSATGVGIPKTRIGAGRTVSFPVLGAAGVPATGVAAVVLHLSSSKPTAATALTLWPTGHARPRLASIDLPAGKTVGTTLIVAPGADGTVSLHNLRGKAGATVEIVGWFPEGSGIAPLTPKRIVDTARGLGATKVRLGANRTITVGVANAAGFPAGGVGAVALRVTAVKPSASTRLTVWRAGEPRPLIASLQAPGGSVSSHMVIVPLDSEGRVSIHNSSGKTNVTLDVLAWFSAGGAFSPVTPARVLDTSAGIGAPKARIAANGLVEVKLTGSSDVPATGVGAVAINITGIKPTAATALTVYEAGGAKPLAATMSVAAGATTKRFVIVRPGTDGKIAIHNAKGKTNIQVDVVGWLSDAESHALDVVLAPDSQLLDSNDIAQVTGNSETGGTIVLTSADPALAIGQRFALIPQPLAPQGLVGTVTAVETGTSGTRTITFAPAALDQVFSDLKYDYSGPVSAAPQPVGQSTDIQAAGTHEKRPLLKQAQPVPRSSVSCSSGNELVVDPTVTFDITNATLSIDLANRHVLIALTATTTVTFSLVLKSSFSCTLDLSRFIYFVPYGDIEIFPQVKISSTYAVSASASWTGSLTIGMEMNGDDITNRSSFGQDADGSIDANETVSLSVSPAIRAEGRLLGVAGLYAELGVEIAGRFLPIKNPCLLLEATGYLDVGTTIGRWWFEKSAQFVRIETDPYKIFSTHVGCPIDGLEKWLVTADVEEYWFGGGGPDDQVKYDTKWVARYVDDHSESFAAAWTASHSDHTIHTCLDRKTRYSNHIDGTGTGTATLGRVYWRWPGDWGLDPEEDWTVLYSQDPEPRFAVSGTTGDCNGNVYEYLSTSVPWDVSIYLPGTELELNAMPSGTRFEMTYQKDAKDLNGNVAATTKVHYVAVKG